jgi:hypothetical protein
MIQSLALFRKQILAVRFAFLRESACCRAERRKAYVESGF